MQAISLNSVSVFAKLFVKGFVVMMVVGLVGTTVGCTQTTQTYAQTVTASDPNRTKQDPKEVAKVRTAIAAQFIQEHKLDDAKRQLESALKSDPKSVEAHDMMGVLLQQEGSPINMKKAEGYFKQAISLDPNFIQAHNNYGVYLSQMKRYDEALAQFEIAGSALGYEGRASALENLGRTALRLNKYDLARQSFLRALDANRQSIIARSELIDMLLADNRALDAKRLHEDLVFLLNEKNLDPRTLLQGAKIAKKTGNTADLQRYSQQLFDIYPLSDQAKQLRGWLSNPAATWK